MKNILLFISLLLMASLCVAQAPQSFRYQAVVRHLDGSIVQNQIVSLRISILPDSPLSNSVYSEWHRLATNEFGIVNIKVGEGTNIMGTFSAINWGAHSFFLKTELDILGNDNYIFIGTTELLSVPYALYAANAVNVDDADADPENEIQVLSFSNDTLYLQNGGWVYLGHYLDNTDQQTLSLSGTTLSISNGNTVVFNEAVDLDGDPTNELQFLSISNDTIYLTNGGYVKLPETFDGNYSSLIGAPVNVSFFSNDVGYITNPNDNDFDPSNEIQMLNCIKDTLSISMGNSVPLPKNSYHGIIKFEENSTWVVPENVYSISIIAIGAGGNGATIQQYAKYANGGGAGGYIESVVAVFPGDLIVLIVGNGNSEVYYQNEIILLATKGDNAPPASSQMNYDLAQGGDGFSYIGNGFNSKGSCGGYAMPVGTAYEGGIGGKGFYNYGNGGHGQGTLGGPDSTIGTNGAIIIKW